MFQDPISFHQNLPSSLPQVPKVLNGENDTLETEQEKNTSEPEGPKVEVPDPREPSGFERGFTPLEILGATEMDGQILFLIQW